jgi:hypothetical protein
LFLPCIGRAQLAQSFYNITNIKTDVLPNAIRVTVETDGNVDLGVDVKDFIDFGATGNDFTLLTVRHFRLRFIGAKAKIPAFVEVGKYPVDAVSVTLAQDKFAFPFYYKRNDFDPAMEAGTPALDLDFRFYVPLKIPYFTFEYGQYYGWTFGGDPIVLKPLEGSIAVASDRRSVIITVMTDRAESNRNLTGLKRSPSELWQHHLKVTPLTKPPIPLTGVGDPLHFSLDALHVPLSEVLDQVAQMTHLRLAAQPDVGERDLTLFLPNTDITGFLRTLSVGYGLSMTRRPETEGGELLVGATGTTLGSERIPIHYSSAERLRLLFPDMLLPLLRADSENNALIVTGSPELIQKVRGDVGQMDKPPSNIQVEALAYEITETENDSLAVAALFAQGKSAFDTGAGTVSMALTDGQKVQYQAVLTALTVRGKARLSAKPSIVVQSGHPGTLFFGQTRFLQVLTNSFGLQSAQIIQIPVGTTIMVTPTAVTDPNADILLDLSPHFSTVNATDASTGLPTLGIRDIQSTLRIRPGDTVLVAGLLSENHSQTRSGIFGKGAKQHDTSSTVLAVFVTAKRITGG